MSEQHNDQHFKLEEKQNVKREKSTKSETKRVEEKN